MLGDRSSNNTWFKVIFALYEFILLLVVVQGLLSSGKFSWLAGKF